MDKVRTVAGIIAEIARRKGTALFVIDYLGLVETQGRFENRNQELSSISRRMKIAAMDYGVPIIAAHQLSRANETESRAPQLSDLRDSGSLEQDADAVLLLDLPSSRKRAADTDKTAVDVIIGKQRNGARSTVRLKAEWTFCRMVEP